MQSRFAYLQPRLSWKNCDWPEEKGEFQQSEQHYATQADCWELRHRRACSLLCPPPPPPHLRLKLRTVKVADVKLEFQSGRFWVDL